MKLEIKISPSLEEKLKPSWMKNNVSKLIDATSHASLNNVREYGFGSAKGNKPSGGSPIWQGKIWENGHYRGYLTESHYIVRKNNNHAQIVTSAEFADSLMEGFSTNWFDSDGNPVMFPENYYHKRAVDKLYSERIVPVIWHNVIGG